MSVPDDKRKEIYEELKWIHLKNEDATFFEKVVSKGIIGVLVPIGCAVTAGVLATGLYYLHKKDSKKQQKFMRYRVLAQGVTIALATYGVFNVKNP